jgi:hypothetical protein
VLSLFINCQALSLVFFLRLKSDKSRFKVRTLKRLAIDIFSKNVRSMENKTTDEEPSWKASKRLANLNKPILVSEIQGGEIPCISLE